MIQRRKFMTWAAASSVALGAPLSMRAVHATDRRPLNLLILGGTRFLGIHLTEAAQARGHTVTFFNRGRTRTDLFPTVERLLGNRDGERDGGLQALDGRTFDAVIDTSGYVPRHVRLSAERLAPHVPHYLFISTVSVYQDFARANDEDSPLGTLEDPSVETVDGRTYGPLKALCEQAAREVYTHQRCTILRPGLIVGPYDNTDRFTYWPARAARGGRFIAPGSPSDPIQIIDARDLADFSIACLERQVTGTFNVISPPDLFSMGDLITGAITAARAAQSARAMQAAQANAAQTPTQAPAEAIWLPADFLATQQVAPWGDMPVWVPDSKESFGFSRTVVTRAQQAGMPIRPLANTLADTLRWHLGRPDEEINTLRAGLSPAREAEVLRAWDTAQASRSP